MESILLAIDPRDPVWIALAFLCGFLVKQIGLPPLVGFLIAGFLLNAAGTESGVFLNVAADMGITLLLFSIGLKLRLDSLIRPEIWGVATIHMALTTLLITGFVMLLSVFALPLVVDIDFYTALMIGFVLSFSSTVFAVKMLDQMGTMISSYGRTAIGVLIMQDIAAVAFLAASTGKLPSLWAFALIALLPLRHILHYILSKVGHDELLILYGIVLAIGGADLFEIVGLKGDLGALVFGMLLASHPKANELAKDLLRFKEVFLVGFFLSVGLTAPPSWNALFLAILFILILPLKTALYFGLFAAFNLRASTSWRSSLTLANYSEFGLIVGTVATASGWLDNEWLAVFAIALSISFIGASPIVAVGDRLYEKWRPRFKLMERTQRLPGEENIPTKNIKVVVFGMGRVGRSVYDSVIEDYPGQVLGVELENVKVSKHKEQGRNIVAGDATNPDFWARAPGLAEQIEWAILALPMHQANVAAVRRIRDTGFKGRIASASRYPEDIEQLEKMGVEFAFNLYAEAGIGFANDLRQRFDHIPDTGKNYEN